ncbi:hypothetical protein AX17_002684 [Amanita inopinata Kibby_2008]|nr:hypothetical protein AX17_002684 [Amanita inopinata Kibby_2008]
MTASVYPHSFLFTGEKLTIAISGPHIQVLDTAKGDILHSTAHSTQDQARSTLSQSGPVRCATVDGEWAYLATSGDDKVLKVWTIDGLKLVNQRELPKKPTTIIFTKDAQTILVSDKFGDVFSYPIDYTPLTEKQKRDALSSHENPSGGKLILGHTSVLTSSLLSIDERYIITADRDEHIRVSWYPQGYVIETYCLGHEKYVSAIHIPSFSPSMLISGGGDPMLKVWDWMSGTLQFEIPVLDAVRPFIRVAAKGKWSDDEDEDDSQPHKEESKRGRGKKGRKKVADEEQEQVLDLVEEGMNTPEILETHASQPNKVLVIHKIASLEVAGSQHIIFSAVGASAVFTCMFGARPAIHAFDLGKPILDFSISSDGVIWALLDGTWNSGSAEEDSRAGTSSLVYTLVLSASLLQLVELLPSDLGTHAAVLSSLNSTCLLPATVEDLRKLDSYADLTWLPKHNDTIDQEGRAKPGHVPFEATGLPEGGPHDVEEKQLTKRELGRLKSKMAVLAKAKETPEKSVGNVTSITGEGVGSNEEAEPEMKRSKSVHEEDSMEVTRS